MTEPDAAVDERLVDPIRANPAFHRTESKVAVAGHPIHAMLVAFPVALTAVPGIRARAASWTHFIIAVMLLSILGANWGYLLSTGYETAVLPYGILLSLFALGFTGFTGWHGGKLVFEYQVGVASTGN